MRGPARTFVPPVSLFRMADPTPSGGTCPTTVPHSGRESSRKAALLYETALKRQAGQRRRPLGSEKSSRPVAQVQFSSSIRMRAS